MQRNTLQQTIILNAVAELHCHASADEVYDLVSKKYPNVKIDFLKCED